MTLRGRDASSAPVVDTDDGYDMRPFLKIRNAYLDVLRAGRRKNMIHGLVELDVTDARQVLRQQRSAGRPALSFTAFVAWCVARAVEADPIVHAYRRRNRLVLFHDVDINLQVEVELDGQKIVQSLIVRAANRRSVEDISTEIRNAQRDPSEGRQRYRGTMAFLTLPAPLRSLAWRAVMGNPVWFKRFGGTVGLSAIGMFGRGRGWAIPIAPPTLMVTVGGISVQPRLVDGVLVEREFLDVTLSFDHAVVDGAPAARFARRLADLVEGAAGLPEPGERPDHRFGHDEVQSGPRNP